MKLSLAKLAWPTLLLLALLQPLFAEQVSYYPYPQPDAGYVTDHAGLLSVEEELRLERWLLQVEEKSNVEIIVVTINSIGDYEGTENRSIESFATALFNSYGIGNMPKNDGVLLLIARHDRKARIELGHFYGKHRDAAANRIMQEVIIPKFKRDDYAAGISNGTEALIEEFAGMRVSFPWHIVGVFVAAVGSLLIGLSCLKNGKRGWGYVFIGIAIILFLLAFYLLREISRHSSQAGGSGGFGGGFSGGGGATGSW